jgi:hypothetical protein
MPAMTSATRSNATEEADCKGKMGSETILPTSTLEPLQPNKQSKDVAQQ